MRRVVLLFLWCVPSLAAQSGAPTPRLDSGTRRAIVDSVARVLQARYVDSAAAVRIGGRLRERLAAGAYDAERAAGFGAALTRDMQAVVADLHLRLSYEPDREFLRPAPAGATPRPPAEPAGPVLRTRRIDGRDSAAIAATNFGYARVERLAGNVGYLKLDRFVPLDYSRATAAAAMAFLANADAVIVDLRDNIGGAPDAVSYLLSYFVGSDTVRYNAAYNRALGITQEHWTLRDVPGRRAPPPPLWILIGPETASAAESFAYGAQRIGIGTLVGERTAGAGNGGSKLSVGAGLALFVPEWTVTLGPGWERTGVTPDVAAPVAEAPAVAHRLALARLAASGGAAAARAAEAARRLP